MAVKTPREGFDGLAFAGIILVLLFWVAYAWEASTGLTFATRRSPGKNSSAAHLAESRRTAIAATLIVTPLVVVYFGVLRRND